MGNVTKTVAAMTIRMTCSILQSCCHLPCGASSSCTNTGTCSSTVKWHVPACVQARVHTHCCRPLYIHPPDRNTPSWLSLSFSIYLTPQLPANPAIQKHSCYWGYSHPPTVNLYACTALCFTNIAGHSGEGPESIRPHSDMRLGGGKNPWLSHVFAVPLKLQ